jgi:hypothetical protein
MIHLRRLVDLDYLAIRRGGLGSQFLYEALFDPDTPEGRNRLGLIDVECLPSHNPAHGYDPNLAGGGGWGPPSVTPEKAVA